MENNNVTYQNNNQQYQNNNQQYQNNNQQYQNNLENSSFLDRMKSRAKNTLQSGFDKVSSVGRGIGSSIKNVGSFAYNQLPGRDGNFNVLTQTGNNRSTFDMATGTNSFERKQESWNALGSAATSLFNLINNKGGRTKRMVNISKGLRRKTRIRRNTLNRKRTKKIKKCRKTKKNRKY
jgi:hypothetical protein